MAEPTFKCVTVAAIHRFTQDRKHVVVRVGTEMTLTQRQIDKMGFRVKVL